MTAPILAVVVVEPLKTPARLHTDGATPRAGANIARAARLPEPVPAGASLTLRVGGRETEPARHLPRPK